MHCIAHLIHHRIVLRVFLLHFFPHLLQHILVAPNCIQNPPQPACITFLTCFTISTSHTLLPLQHHVAQQCMRHIAHLFKISSSFVYSSYITLPPSPNTFSSYPIALNFPSATSASAAPRPCHHLRCQQPPSASPHSHQDCTWTVMVRKLSGSLPFCSPAPHRQNRVNLLVILLQGRHVFPRLLRTVPLSPYVW